MRSFKVSIAIGLVVALASTAALAQFKGWRPFVGKKYGFSVLLPKGAETIKRSLPDKWGGMYSKLGDIEILSLAKMGVWASQTDIQKFAVDLTKVPATMWKKIDEGVNKNGWKVFQTFQAEGNGKVLFAILGTGPKGSYLIFLQSSAADVAKKKKKYNRWYQNVKLF